MGYFDNLKMFVAIGFDIGDEVMNKQMTWTTKVYFLSMNWRMQKSIH